MKELGKEYKLQGEYDGFYPKWNEERQESFDVFKYALKGSPEAIAEYKTKMVEKGYTVRYADEAETKPIFFTLDFAGQQAEIKITTGGAIVINDEQLRQIQSLAKRTNGIIQEKIADQGVAMLLGNIFGKNAKSAPVEDREEEDENESFSPDETDFEEEGS